MKKVNVIIVRTGGTNCDKETAFAFESAGAHADLVHINQLISREYSLLDYQILAVPGGFTYGDDIASGKILANELRHNLYEDLRAFVKNGKLIIGICNGFQVLVKCGLLPNFSGDCGAVDATLTLNDSAKFEDRWVYLKRVSAGTRRINNRCVWTKGIHKTIYLPVAHAEGKFIPRNGSVMKKLVKNGYVVFEYVDKNGKAGPYPWNPNGSVHNIAGITDTSGRIFGLMPHPERHISPLQHPRWTRGTMPKVGDGFLIFKNGVEYCKNHL
ncbi:MAG: phosphoribosylformylglycinamidine synthase I [Candidatus Omnitrophota bacterium]